MRQVRLNTFETNSSSTHTMLIPLDAPKELPKRIDFHIGEFGWTPGDANPADYLYTALLDYHPYYEQDLFIPRMKFLKDTLDEYGIEYSFEEPKWQEPGNWMSDEDKAKMQTPGILSWESGYIDHAEELGWFLTEVFSDKQRLINFLVDGKVRTGNDNCMEMDSVRSWLPEDWKTKGYYRCEKDN